MRLLKTILFFLVITGLLLAEPPGAGSAIVTGTSPSNPPITCKKTSYIIARGKALPVHIVDVDLNSPDFIVSVGMPAGGLGSLEPLSTIARNNGATAAINGGYFNPGGFRLPTDMVIKDGRIITKGSRDYACFGVTSSGRVFIDSFQPSIVFTICRDFRQYTVEAVNHPCGVGIVYYDRKYGTSTKTNKTSREIVVEKVGSKEVIKTIQPGSSEIPENGYVLSFQGVTSFIIKDLKAGDEVSVGFYYPEAYRDVKDLLAAGPMLIKDGRPVKIDLTFYQKSLAKRHPRSALGLTRNNHLLLVAVDGRGKYGAGLTFKELQSLMLRLGARQAISLDGGSSTTLYYQGQVINSPANGKETKIANAVLILPRPLPVLPGSITPLNAPGLERP